MRRILLIAHRVPVSGAFTLSNDLRRDTEMTILFVAEPPPRARRIRLVGERLRFLNPDERSTAALLKNALVRAIPAERETQSSPGLFVGPVDPEAELRAFAAQPGTVWLTESGAPLRASGLPGSEHAAILSDPYDPTPAEATLLGGLGLPRLSLGPRSLRSSQCIDVWQNELDLRAAAEAARESSG